MIKLLFAAAVLAALIYGGHRAYRFARWARIEIAARRDPKERILRKRRRAEEIKADAQDTKLELAAGHPRQVRLDAIISLAERDIREADDALETLESKELEKMERRALGE